MSAAVHVPSVSIVLPTFNRRSTLPRAIKSVLAQTWTDWELIVVDDGSTDGSADLVEAIADPRVRLARQSNRGAAAARNHGLSLCRGRWITFLDSDDEWLPNFLALCCGFLERHPDQLWVATESLEVRANGRVLRQDLQSLSGHYVDLARRIGSSALALPAGTDDDYLRVYKERHPIGGWAEPLLDRSVAPSESAHWYHGPIGELYRWGYFHALWCIVVRREALEGLSPFPEHRRSCNDLQFLIELALRHPSNLLSVPAVRKHEIQRKGGQPAQLTTGRAYVEFTRNYAQVIEQCFVNRLPHDEEVRRLYAFRRLEAGRAALSFGLRDEALNHFRAAAPWLTFRSVPLLKWMARWSPTDRVAALLMSAYQFAESRWAH